MKKKMFIWGGWFGSHNIGDEAILMGVRDIFKLVNPEIDISALTADPEYTKNIQGVKPVQAGFKKNFFRILKTLTESDIILVSGGTSIYDYDHGIRCLKTIYPKVIGKKIRFFGVSSRKIVSAHGKFLIKSIIDMSNGISVRDKMSEKLLQDIGVKKDIKVTGDSALFIEPNFQRKLEGKTKICICPRVLSSDYKKHYHQKISEEEVLHLYNILSGLINYFLENDAKIYIIPFHTESYDNDWAVIKKILPKSDKLNNKIEILNKRGKTPPDQVMGLINQMDLVIGLRLHSLIFAGACNVPMLTFDYDSKIRAFMEMVGLRQYCVPLDTKLSELINKSQKIIKNKWDISKKLNKKIKLMKKRIMDDAKEINDLLCC